MSKITILLGAGSLLMLSASAGFADPSVQATPQVQASAPADDPDEIICKQQPAPTGSRLGAARVCARKKEWDQRMKDAQEATARGEMKGMGGSGGGN